jgi:hypothetical protein
MDNPPANWAQTRDLWDAANAFRCAMFTRGFAIQLVAVLLPSGLVVGARQRAVLGRAQSSTA